MVIPGDPAQVAHQRTSMDWNVHASGMVFYDDNNPTGATIDGEPDSIVLTPLSRWTQVSGITGTVVIVNEFPAGLGGTQSTYYKDDDSTPDSADTGDQLYYGDAGFQVDNPNPGTYTLLRHVYFLTETVSVEGADYVDYYDNPIQVSVAVFRPPKISVAATTNVANIYPGETANYTLSLTASKGLTMPVTLALQGAPAGAVASFDPNPLTPPGASQLHITTTVSTVIGTYAMTVTASTGQMTDTTFLTLTINPRLDLAAQPAARTVLPGDTAVYSLSVSASEGFHLPVTLTLQGAPAGAVISFDPNPIAPPGASQLHVTTAASTIIGTYVLTVTGASGQATDSTLLTLTINPVLTLTAQSAVAAILPGDTAMYTLSASASQGFNEPVTLALQGAPPNVTASFTPNPLTPPGSSQLHISTTASTAAGTYALTATAASDQVASSAPLTLTINPTFTLNVQPSVCAILPGDTAVYTLSTSASPGFNVPVTLSLQGAPLGAVATFAPNPLTSPGDGQLYVSAAYTTTAGTYALAITGASGVYTRTAHSTLIVASVAPSFTLGVFPTSRIAKPNQAVSYTVAVSRAGTLVGSLNWSVTLTVVGLPTGVGATWSANPVTPGGSSILTLAIPGKPSYGNHLLQIVGAVGTQVVAHGIELTIEPLRIYLPIISK
jgi:hypothetical protein